MNEEDWELDESQLSTKELMKRRRKEAYEKQKLAQKEQRTLEKVADREKKAQEKKKKLADLWAAMTPASELEESGEGPPNA